jgi:hypothetical protein
MTEEEKKVRIATAVKKGVPEKVATLLVAKEKQLQLAESSAEQTNSEKKQGVLLGLFRLSGNSTYDDQESLEKIAKAYDLSDSVIKTLGENTVTMAKVVLFQQENSKNKKIVEFVQDDATHLSFVSAPSLLSLEIVFNDLHKKDKQRAIELATLYDVPKNIIDILQHDPKALACAVVIQANPKNPEQRKEALEYVNSLGLTEQQRGEVQAYFATPAINQQKQQDQQQQAQKAQPQPQPQNPQPAQQSQAEEEKKKQELLVQNARVAGVPDNVIMFLKDKEAKALENAILFEGESDSKKKTEYLKQVLSSLTKSEQVEYEVTP